MSQFPEINTESKLRLRLTAFARNTLQEDTADFGLGLATLLNRMLAGFAPVADASVSLRLAAYRKRLSGVLGEEGAEVCARLMAAEAQRLQEARPVYEDRTESVVFRVTNENLFLLTQDPTTQEERWYGSLKAYVEALAEEFARRPFLAREAVYYHEAYQALQDAIRDEMAVCLVHQFGQKYLVRVFAVVTDPFALYHYVIARFLDPAHGKQDGRIYSFRLSRIEKVLPRPGLSGAFTAEEKKKTARAVAKNGAPFLCDRVSKVVVTFTDAGLKQFASQMYLRPHVTKIREDGRTYEFACPNHQAFFYFQRLGAGAEVLKPAWLRRDLAKWFAAAAEQYQDA